MDITTITTLVGSYGFPIVACGAMFWMLNRNEERHEEEEKKLTEAVNNNTQIIKELLITLKSEIGGEK